MAIGRPVSLTGNVASKSISVTATEGQTLFTVTGGYRINQIAVFRNGARLVDGQDYTARDGSSVTLISGANLNDTLEFQIFDDFRVADAIVNAESDQTINGNLTVTGTLTGAAIGIQSGGTSVGAAKTLNFIGTGNTFVMNGDTVDISISGGSGGGGLGTAINYANDTPSPFSFIDKETTVTSNLLLDATNAGASDSYVVSVIPNITVNSGVAVTVGTGKTMIIDVLQIGDL
jgi:hypothetical protein|tara:strand:+ start:18 stop:713 length:696 start_codon:yes stop_codon:yes gene_type:complete